MQLTPQLIYMETIEKQCIYCAKRIRGRADKKFCDCSCRTSFHNIQNGNTNNCVRRINGMLQKNRKILAQIHDTFPRKKTIPIHWLYSHGFNLAHFTHQQKHLKLGTYTCCYDYGYKLIGKYEIAVIHF